MESNQQQEEEDDCPICNELLNSKLVRMTCCGKKMHIKCRDDMLKSSMSETQKNTCIMCRTKKTNEGSKEEIERLRRWVEKGKAWAQNMLGQRYERGIGVEQSDQQAKELFELSANQGHANAQCRLGDMYRTGQGVDQSYEKAAEYYEAAARQGYGMAQCNLGVAYATGNGVEQSNETGRKWLLKSAEQGEENAIGALQQLDEIEGRTTPSFIPKPIECATCYRPHDPPEHKLRPCKRCHRVYYCGRECQVKHWKLEKNGHKKICNKKAIKKAK